MTIAVFVRGLLPAAERPINAWFDLERDGRATLILLFLFVILWTVFHTISHASIGVHFDQSEIFDWSRHPGWGNYKHPPLGGWVGTAWYSLFPAADWSSYLLAMVNSAFALLAVDLIARRYLSGDKRLLVLLLLLLTPFYQFHSQKFASNQTLLSTWPIATYCFLRAFETRGTLWSAAAGAATALAMLGKYYSAYLVGSFVLAALVHPARWNYLKSTSPWISAAVGLAVLAPHIYWLVTTGFQPFTYAYSVHGTPSLFDLFRGIGAYLIGALAYMSVPIAVFWLAAWPNPQVFAETLWPRDPDRRMLVVLLAGQLFLPPLSSPFLGVKLTSLWTMSAWFLLPIVLLASASVTVPRRCANHVGLLVAATAAVCLLAAPAVAWSYHAYGARQYRNYYRPLTRELVHEWRNHTAQPLKIVTGHADLAMAVTFYSRDHPDAMPNFQPSSAPWITPERLRREGWAAVCPSEDRNCVEQAEQRAASEPKAQRRTIESVPQFFGIQGKPHRFFVWVVPPQ